MDATQTDRAIIVGFSMGAQRALLLAADHPERVEAAVFIGPTYPGGGHPRPERTVYCVGRRARHRRGLGEVQQALLAARLPGLPRVLLRHVFTEPHSTKPIEDCVGWGLETDGRDARADPRWRLTGPNEAASWPERVRCPVLVVHGDRDGQVDCGAAGSRSPSTPAASWLCSRVQDMHRMCVIRSRSICCCGISSSRLRHRDAGCAESPVASVRSTSPPRSVSGTRSGMWRLRMSCAKCIPISRLIGSLSIR